MSHVQQNLDAMITCADRQCPTAMSQKEGKTKSELREVCQKKCQISPDFISSLIMNQLGMEVHNKVNELNLVIASHITEKVIDDIIDSLSGISKSLVSEVGSLRKKRSLTPDVLKGRSSSVSDSNEQETISLSGTTGTGASGDATSQKSESSPIGTPQTNKRKSLHGRKLRPKSVADGAQEKDTSSSSPPSGNTTRSADDSAPDLLASSKPRANGTIEEDTVPELPSTTVLQHLGKARPKRAKRHAPSRGAIVQHNTSTDGEDDGLSKFYTSSANASLSPGSTPSGSPLLEESPHPRGGSISSISREVFSKSVSKNSSKEDLAGGGTPPSGGAISSLFARKMSSEDSRKMASPDVDRRSPVPPPKPSLNSSGEKSKLSSGFSCLTSTTTDSDDDSAGRINLAKPSPEKRALSPSLHSISDIFGSKSPSAVSKSQKESKESSSSTPVSSSSSKVAAALSPGISPFASRKTDSELLSTRRKSFNPGEDDKAQAPSSSSEATDSGKKTPDEVVKRHGIGHGRNPDLMAEIKEKRASMVPKAATDTDLLASPSRAMSTSTTAGLFGGGQSSENLMERVKLR